MSADRKTRTRLDASRVIHAPTGTHRTAKSWLT